MTKFGILAIAMIVVGGAVVLGVRRWRFAEPTERAFEVSRKQPAKDMSLACEAKVLDDVIEVTFTLTNDTKEAIFAFDHGAERLTTDAVYADEAASVTVIIGVPDFPPRTAAAWKYHPKTTKLAAGAAKGRAFELKLPLREGNPYSDAKYDDYTVVEVTRLRLIVDFLRESNARLEGSTPVPKGPVEHAICETVLTKPVELRQRQGDFFRG